MLKKFFQASTVLTLGWINSVSLCNADICSDMTGATSADPSTWCSCYVTSEDYYVCNGDPSSTCSIPVEDDPGAYTDLGTFCGDASGCSFWTSATATCGSEARGLTKRMTKEEAGMTKGIKGEIKKKR